MKTEKWVSRYEDEYGNVFEGHYIEVGSKEILTEKVECTHCNGTGFSGSMQFVGIFRRQTCRVCFGSGTK